MFENNKEKWKYVEGIFEELKGPMYRMAMKVVKEHSAAQDVVSSACIRMMEEAERIAAVDADKRTYYVLAIVRNTAKMYLRNSENAKCTPIDDESMLDIMADEHGSVEEFVIYNVEIELLRKAIGMIDERFASFLELKYVQEKDDEFIAAIMNVSKNSVRYYMTLARRQLEQKLKELEY